MNSSAWIALTIFAIVIFCIATEIISRTIAAMLGAMAMVLFGIIDSENVASFIDFNTIGLLIGMMLVVATVKRSGIFEYIAIRMARLTKGNAALILTGFALITAVLSALLDNVTTVLLIGPMTFIITDLLHLDPIPFIITEIISSNIGGTSTLIGDPPNIMIGSAAHLGFTDFIINLFPVVAVILAITLVILYFIYHKALKTDSQYTHALLALDEKKAISSTSLLVKSMIVMTLILLGFIFHTQIGISSSIIALTGAAVILFISGENPEEIFGSVEWMTIAFFSSLFVLVGGLESVGFIEFLAGRLLTVFAGNERLLALSILFLSAIISSFLDNIPFVATLIPMITALGQAGINTAPLWWAVSLGACLGGNGTLIGASANLVLANISARHNHRISFGSYFKIGFPLMLLSVGIAAIYLLIFYL